MLLCLVVAACSDELSEAVVEHQENSNPKAKTSEITDAEKETYLADFAKILSVAVYERQDVRAFLKRHALECFDKNYDVLYVAVKDEYISGQKFCEILSSYSSENEIDEITSHIPLLNVYLTDFPAIGIHAEDLNEADADIPTCVSMSDSTRLFYKGTQIDALQKGEIPDFHVLVVGENSRVTICDPRGSNKSLNIFELKDEAFNGFAGNSNLKSIALDGSTVGRRAYESWKYFNSSNSGVNQKAFQRDYIYYGITPDKPHGDLIKSVSEYIGYIKVPASAFYTISDQKSGEDPYADPYIKQPTTQRYQKQYSANELIDIMWTRGAFNFKFEIITSTQEIANTIYIPLTPSQLWDFHIEHTTKHKTWFRHTRHYYRIDADKFTPKNVILETPADMGKWNIAEESLFRIVKIYEEDKGKETLIQQTYEMTKANSTNFSGNAKVTIGLGDSTNPTIEPSTSINNSTTTKFSKTITTKWVEGADELGKVTVYYYDPIIDFMTSDGQPILHTYNTGSIEFGIIVK